MKDRNPPAIRPTMFEQLKQVNQYGAEYWSARDLQPLLGYTQWRSFENAITKATTSCGQSGNDPEHHFAGARKPIIGGKGAVQEVVDYHLSRFACYLIAQNGDPRKPEIANAQKYFAVQTRRQEISDVLAADDAGYKGLYGAKGADDIKRFKGIARRENLMDRMNTTELAANQFRMTQAREKLHKQKIRGQEQAIDTHKKVGQEVRDAIKRIGGTMPENIPPAEHIKQVKKRLKGAAPHLELAETDAEGLSGQQAKEDEIENNKGGQ